MGDGSPRACITGWAVKIGFLLSLVLIVLGSDWLVAVVLLALLFGMRAIGRKATRSARLFR